MTDCQNCGNSCKEQIEDSVTLDEIQERCADSPRQARYGRLAATTRRGDVRAGSH